MTYLLSPVSSTGKRNDFSPNRYNGQSITGRSFIKVIKVDKHEGNGVQSVQRALQLLSLFAPHRTNQVPHRKRWSVSDLARATGLHKSIVARMMMTMAREGYVVQDPMTRQYSVGPQAFAVGYRYEPHTILNAVARPAMEVLTQQVGHASYLGVPAGSHYVFILSIESRCSIRVTIELGERRNYHSGAIGKILLSGMSNEAFRDLVGSDPLPKLTPYTITSVDQLIQEVAEIQRIGIAFNRQEAILGADSIAVGIRDARGEIIAGLGIIYPSHLVSGEEAESLIIPVREAGLAISQRMGGVDRETLLALG